MREIKFKAWDKEYEEFCKIPFGFKIKDLNYYTDYEWLQYTGLKDKNGKEIYEGDVVKIKEDILGLHYIERIGEVYISKKGTYLIRYDERYFELYDYISECEIIGNIYENKELLKGE